MTNFVVRYKGLVGATNVTADYYNVGSEFIHFYNKKRSFTKDEKVVMITKKSVLSVGRQKS